MSSSGGAHADITTQTRQLFVSVEFGGFHSDDLPAAAPKRRTLTLSFEERVVWSCVPDMTCAADDVWYKGPGLYTFAMDDDFATDVWVDDDALRLELNAYGIENEAGALELDYVSARVFTDGNDIAHLQHEKGSWSLANASGVELVKESMTAQLEQWDGNAWRFVPRARMFLCGTGWNPLVRVGEVDDVYLPLSAHRRAMAEQQIEMSGTFRVRYPFRVMDEEEPRLASMIIDLDEATFDPSSSYTE
jgi:hypothetical protein